MKQKPIILWTCDLHGWAYNTRIQTMRLALLQFEHRTWIAGNVPPSLLSTLMEAADIIVFQGIPALQCFLDMHIIVPWPKIILRLDSVRLATNEGYFDVFAKGMSCPSQP